MPGMSADCAGASSCAADSEAGAATIVLERLTLAWPGPGTLPGPLCDTTSRMDLEVRPEYDHDDNMELTFDSIVVTVISNKSLQVAQCWLLAVVFVNQFGFNLLSFCLLVTCSMSYV